MSIEDRVFGRNTKIFWIDAGGTVEISGNRRSGGVTREVLTQQTEAGNDNFSAVDMTLYHYAAEMTAFYAGGAGSAVLARLKEGSKGTLLYGLDGTVAGKGKGAFAAMVISQPRDVPFPDAIEVTVSWEGRSALIFDDNIDVWP